MENQRSTESKEQLRAQEVAPILKFYQEEILMGIEFFEEIEPEEKVLMGTIDIKAAAKDLPENISQRILELIESVKLTSSDADAMFLAYQTDPELTEALKEKGYKIEQVQLDMDNEKSDLAIYVRKIGDDQHDEKVSDHELEKAANNYYQELVKISEFEKIYKQGALACAIYQAKNSRPRSCLGWLESTKLQVEDKRKVLALAYKNLAEALKREQGSEYIIRMYEEAYEKLKGASEEIDNHTVEALKNLLS